MNEFITKDKTNLFVKRGENTRLNDTHQNFQQNIAKADIFKSPKHEIQETKGGVTTSKYGVFGRKDTFDQYNTNTYLSKVKCDNTFSKNREGGCIEPDERFVSSKVVSRTTLEPRVVECRKIEERSYCKEVGSPTIIKKEILSSELFSSNLSNMNETNTCNIQTNYNLLELNPTVSEKHKSGSTNLSQSNKISCDINLKPAVDLYKDRNLSNVIFTSNNVYPQPYIRREGHHQMNAVENQARMTTKDNSNLREMYSIEANRKDTWGCC